LAAAKPALERWGRDLRRLRVAADVSQETVAQEVAEDGSKSWTSQVESGQIDPPFSKIVAYAEAVGARVALTSDDPWTTLDVAIHALPERYIHLRRHLYSIVRDERATAEGERPKKAAAGSSR
jgi:transcriptional regulator with XRE-family HTH domain